MTTPRGVKGLLAIDVGLTIAYAGLRVLGEPSSLLKDVLDLDGEANAPTWYASAQWLVVALLLGIAAWRMLRRDRPRTWLLLALPLIFLVLSLDEVATLHEQLGNRSDVLLPGGTRAGGPFAVTGIWMWLLGIPFIVIMIGLVLAAMSLIRSPSGWRLLAAGVVVLLAGAIGVEAASNFIDHASFTYVIEVAIEETLEAVGATITVWGAWVLARASGFDPFGGPRPDG